MKTAETRELTTEELQNKLKDLKEELLNPHFQPAINQFDNPIRISAVRKDITRIKTVLRDSKLRDGAKVQWEGGIKL